MEKPVLIMMAAGMGSRYGGLKQLDKMDDDGHVLMDYSVYDAHLAGFETVIFIIKPEMEETFENAIGSRLRKYMDVKYAYQRLENLPEGFAVPEGRQKPWGTAHAVLSAEKLVNGPFSAVNADDYYGRTAFQTIYNFLAADHNPSEHAMVGYKIENTLTENGYVSRGICQLDENNCLTGIVERLHIEVAPGGATVTEDNGSFFVPDGTIVSMNLWGFQHSMMDAIHNNFAAYLKENLPKNPLKCEYFLPLVPNLLITQKKATVKVLPTDEKWYGITYHEDKISVMAALKSMRDSGKYPDHF